MTKYEKIKILHSWISDLDEEALDDLIAQYIDEPITEIDNTRGHVITEVPINSRKVQEVIDNPKEWRWNIQLEAYGSFILGMDLPYSP